MPGSITGTYDGILVARFAIDKSILAPALSFEGEGILCRGPDYEEISVARTSPLTEETATCLLKTSGGIGIITVAFK
ncbi:MAG: hypothetical protein PHN75_02685 [Syntrophales bacterium]|nr:hypothetical protein [Syntrophales bacterium]